MSNSAISPKRSENYPEWYQQVVKEADLAENAPVRGCMVIKPWGYALWENMQKVLDGMFKDTGHVNAYFPLLIPLNFLEQEAAHVEGFAKECAVVTHHRLKADVAGKLIPDGELEEPFVIRPTSETIIGHMYAKWVRSYRDLPLLMNQWCNVMRWELRTRLFLRTAEFLWQEGHTVHATADEAVEETLRMLHVYSTFAQNYMAMPVIRGLKTVDERFPGAVDTYSIEAMMQDRKALQAGTSHFLGQNFAKASSIKYLSAEGREEFGWTTSWGVSTRLIGGLIMTHSDDDGLVLPPKLAPLHVVILPIYRSDDEKGMVIEYCESLRKELSAVHYEGERLRVKLDLREGRGGEKAWQYIKQGVPIRLEVGPRDIAKQEVFMGRRDRGPKQKESLARAAFVSGVESILTEIQRGLFEKALLFRKQNTRAISTLEELKGFFLEEDSGGFAIAPWSEKAIGADLLKDLKVTPRCLPLEEEWQQNLSDYVDRASGNRCLFSGEVTDKKVIFAKSY